VTLVDGQPRRLDGAVDEIAQERRLTFQLNLAGRNPRDVEQIVDEPHHVTDLPLHDRAYALDRGRRAAGQANQLETGPDRRQRIPQFVGKRREELVLLAIGIPQLLLGFTHRLLGPAANPCHLHVRPDPHDELSR
jgi:hypothetical protein